MKKFVLKFGMALLFGAALTFTACGGEQSAADATEQHDHDHADHDHADHDHGEGMAMEGHGEGQEYTSAYVCPMHCEGSGSEEPGKCPVCGMAYVTKEEHDENPHSH